MLTGAVLALAGSAALAQGGAKATADIKGDGITGKVELVERKVGTGVVVDVTVSASGLKPGLQAARLHAVGKCELISPRQAATSIPVPPATPIPMPTIRSTWATSRTSRSGATARAR